MPLLVAARGCAVASGRPAGGVDVHLVDLTVPDGALASAESSLTLIELARARRGTPAVHRRRVLLRAALRTALGAELGMDPREVPILTSPLGRPYVDPADRAPLLDVSCSASGTLGVVAIGRRRRIGVDVERVAPWSADVLDEGWLCDSEREALTRLPVADRAVAVTRCWTQKEAVLKARGTGLHDDPAATITAVGRSDGEVAGWQIQDVPVPHGWVASLAATPEKEIPA